MNVLSGRRFLFINYMINSGGMNLALGSTLSAAEIYCLSDFSDDKLLPAIHQIKVTQQDCFIALYHSKHLHICIKLALHDHRIPVTNRLHLSPSSTETVRSEQRHRHHDRRVRDQSDVRETVVGQNTQPDASPCGDSFNLQKNILNERQSC